MEQPAFVAEQDFQTAKRNQPNYAVAVDISYFQSDSFPRSTFPDESLTSLVYRSTIPPEALQKNRPPGVSSLQRSRFKQRTFSGKPLSDDATIQAAQVAGEIEDAPFMRRLFGK
jgi:hypothetical protein